MSRRTGSLLAAILAIAAVPTAAQWINYPTPGIPRTPDGKPDLSAPVPRTADGKPDLSGLWRVEPTGLAEMTRLFGANRFGVPGDDPANDSSKYFLNILADFRSEESPIRPEAAAALRPPANPCLPFLFLSPQLISASFKVIQASGLIAILYEAGWNYRQIYLDARKPPPDAQPLWFGYSVGKWEGDTLVVNSTGFNDKTSLDAFGHPHSDALHLIERYRRRDFGHMDVEVTVDDPKMYTKPFTIKFTELLLPDSDVMEYVCEENEKDVQHLKKQ
jgi:hypothetical protein